MKVLLLSNDRMGAAAICGIGGVASILSYMNKRQSGFMDLSSHADTLWMERGDWGRATDFVDRVDPDVLLACGWSRMIPEELTSTRTVVGVHPSPLPERRGGAPVVNTILDAVGRTAVSFYRMGPVVDRGDVYAQIPITVNERETSTGLYELVLDAIRSGSERALERAVDDDPIFSEGTFGSMPDDIRPQRRPSQSELNLMLPWFLLDREIRAFQRPYPQAFVRKGGKRLHVCSTPKVAPKTAGTGDVSVVNGKLVLTCADASLRFESVDWEER